MCSVYGREDHFEIEGKELPMRSSQCLKCYADKPVILRGRDPLCRLCFLGYCRHKFRSTIGKSHKLKPGQLVLVCYSGGTASTAMLHMIQMGVKETSHKRILFRVALLHIHEGDEENIEDTQAKVTKLLSTGFPVYLSWIDLALEEKGNQHTEVTCTDEIQEFLKGSKKCQLSKLETHTSRDDIRTHLRLKLIGEVGKKIGCDKIMMGDSSSSLAIQLLSHLALGRGSQIPNSIGFEDTRYGSPILRPLREFNSKELAFYSHLNSLESQVTSMLDTGSSIQNLSRDFVVSLQEQFSSTVPTIFRTGDKICSISNEDDERQCLLCQSRIDKIEGSSAIHALLFSERLTTDKDDDCEDTHQELCFACSSCLKSSLVRDALSRRLLRGVEKS